MTFIENLGYKGEEGTVAALLKQCVTTIIRKERTVVKDVQCWEG